MMHGAHKGHGMQRQQPLEAALCGQLAAQWLRRQHEAAEGGGRSYIQRMMEQHEASPPSLQEQLAYHLESSRQYASAAPGPPAVCSLRGAAPETAHPRGGARLTYGGRPPQGAPGMASGPRHKGTPLSRQELAAVLPSPTNSVLSQTNTQCPSPMNDPLSRPGSSGNLQALAEGAAGAAKGGWPNCFIQHPSAQSRANGQQKKAYKRRRRTENPGEPEVHAATTFWALWRLLFSCGEGRAVSPYEFYCTNERLLAWTRRCPVGTLEDRFPEEIAAVARGVLPDGDRKPSPMPPKPKRHQVMLDSQSFFVQERSPKLKLMDNLCCQVIAGYIAFFGDGYLEQGVIGNMLSEQPGTKEVSEHVCPKILTEKGDKVHKESTGSLISFLMGEEGKKWFSVAPGMNGRYFICNRSFDLIERDAMLGFLGEYKDARRMRDKKLTAEAHQQAAEVQVLEAKALEARSGAFGPSLSTGSPFSSASFASFSSSFDDTPDLLPTRDSTRAPLFAAWDTPKVFEEPGDGEEAAPEQADEAAGIEDRLSTCRALFGDADEGAVGADRSAFASNFSTVVEHGEGEALRQQELDDMYQFLYRKKKEFLNPRSTWFSRHFGEPH